MNLLAVSGGLVLDIVFFALIALGLILGACRGFVKGICKLAGTLFAVFFAVTFCIPMKNQLDTWFGLTKALGGTTAAGWGAIVISFVILVVLIKIGAWLVGKLGTKLVDKSVVAKGINHVLGAVLGVAKALLVIFIILAILKWIGLESIDSFIDGSAVVGKLYSSSWFINAFHLPR